MVALNMSMISSLSILLGSVNYPNSSLQLQHQAKVTGSTGGECCEGRNKPCCNDPCDLDPPEVYIDPSVGIPTDDASLTILLGLKWPIRDFPWFIQVFRKFLLPKLRRKRQVQEFPDELSTETSGFESTTGRKAIVVRTTETSMPVTSSTGTPIGSTAYPTILGIDTTSTTPPTSSTSINIFTITTPRKSNTSAPIITTSSAPIITTTSTPIITTTSTITTSSTPIITPASTPVITTTSTITTSSTPIITTSSTPIITTSSTPIITTASTPIITTTRTTSSTPIITTTSTPIITTTSTPPINTTSTPIINTASTPIITTTSTPISTTTSTPIITTASTPISPTTSTAPRMSTTSTTASTTTTHLTSTTSTTASTTTTHLTSTTSTTSDPTRLPDDPFGEPVDDNVSDEEILEVEDFVKEIEIERVFELLDQNTTTEQSEALEVGEESLREKELIEKEIFEANITFSSGSASLTHQLGFRKTDPDSTRMALGGFILVGATKSFREIFDLPIASVSGCVILGPIADCLRLLGEFNRPQIEPCFPNNPYRTLDGSCNNIASVMWGAAFTPYRRDLYPVYHDGVSTFRKSVTNSDLPSARLVSLLINTIRSEESPSFSILHMTFGQFIDHDLIKTPLARGRYGGSPIKCCDTPRLNPECAPITIPSNDSFYSCYGQTCMEFVRSASIPLPCRLFPREQGNEQSSYLDGSVVYGVKPAQTKDLRNGTCGLLKQQVAEDGRMLLPKELNMNDGCNTPEMVSKGRYCFKTGDGRTNEQILLTFFQTLFGREHNRIARIFCKCHGQWDDEKIFQETRRIVWALLQQITYNEYLPTIIGPSLMTSSKLFPLKGNAQTNDYSPNINAAIGNNFATAAFRFGHSLIADNLLYVTKHGKTSPKELSTLLFNPFDLYRKDAVCDIARGGLNLPESKMDPYFTPEITGKLFRGPHPFGLDLLALNIQRGRDHGLPSYNRWRVFCGLRRALSFNDLINEMTQDRIDALRSVYRSVEDIDLYIGGVSEGPIPGGILGHTFTCLVHNQFFRMKYGDRYWFEYKNSPGAFTPGQLEQLHNATLAMVMCNNLPELEYIQRWPLRNPGPDNPKVCCKSIRRYSLKPWVPDCLHEDHNGHEGDCKKKEKKGDADINMIKNNNTIVVSHENE